MGSGRRAWGAALTVLCLMHPFQSCRANPSDSGLRGLARILRRGKWTAQDVSEVHRIESESIRGRKE